MGKQQSKSASNVQEGNTNVQIEEHIETNYQYHEMHEIKLWIILITNLMLVLYVIKKELQKRWRRQGFQRATTISQNNLNSPV